MELLVAAAIILVALVVLVRVAGVDPTVAFVIGVFVFGTWFVYFRGH